jgi:hypothetical protein
LSWSCGTEDGAVIVKNAGVIWAEGIFATVTESIGFTIKVSGAMENSEVEV